MGHLHFGDLYYILVLETGFGRMGKPFDWPGTWPKALERQPQDQRKCPCSKWGLVTNLTGWVGLVQLGRGPTFLIFFVCWMLWLGQGQDMTIVCISIFGSSINLLKLTHSISIYKHLHILMEDPKQNFERRQLKFGTWSLLKFFFFSWWFQVVHHEASPQVCNPTLRSLNNPALKNILNIENGSCTHRIHVWCIYLHLP